ncbi:conserved exported hypothetical protein [Tenacibaculum litopenaei]|uniref:DUF2490 domain-containing protein n=1 Tax=Tenacibaculum litopenaei TaxID=396016 RepID=UPI003892DD63
MKKILMMTWVFGLLSTALYAQDTTLSGWLPKVVLTKKINSQLKWVQSVEAREQWYKDDWKLAHRLVDVSTLVSIKSGYNRSVNVGYILRFKAGERIHRTVQHYNIVTGVQHWKLAHRIGFEQFFQSGKRPQYRARYRLGAQRALSGEKLDPKEWYVKLTNEYLYQFNKRDFELRVSPYVGYLINPNNKLEFGVDYRYAHLFEPAQAHSLWFRTTWYITIN